MGKGDPRTKLSSRKPHAGYWPTARPAAETPVDERIVVHVGLDLSRRRVGVCLICGQGELIAQFPAPADRVGLRGLAARVGAYGQPVRGVIESMNGARFVHDELVAHGWEVLVAD